MRVPKGRRDIPLCGVWPLSGELRPLCMQTEVDIILLLLILLILGSVDGSSRLPRNVQGLPASFGFALPSPGNVFPSVSSLVLPSETAKSAEISLVRFAFTLFTAKLAKMRRSRTETHSK